MDIEPILDRHEVIVLEFSGGKDSLACLYLLKPWWERITVLFTNTGDVFPETIKQMEEIEALVPHFTMIWTGQPRQMEENGFPTDVLPFWDSPLGRQLYANRKFKLQSPTQCCGENIWFPMDDAVKSLKATLIIRGQRKEDSRRGPIFSGYMENNVEYLFPIEDWSTKEVLEFLEKNQVTLPRQYEFFNSSLGCQHCTAYLGYNDGKFRYMEKYHPELNREVKSRLQYILRAVDASMIHLRAVTE